MDKREELITFGSYDGHYGWHKGFYNDDEPERSLSDVTYIEFFDTQPDDVNFVCDEAFYLLRGVCDVFALSLSKVFGYTPYIIEGKGKKEGFHAFCQVVRKHQLFFADARGLTTSFDEFMSVAKDFVSGEFIIREITPQDIDEWKNSNEYYEEYLAFAEAVINKYKYCYSIK